MGNDYGQGHLGLDGRRTLLLPLSEMVVGTFGDCIHYQEDVTSKSENAFEVDVERESIHFGRNLASINMLRQERR